MLSALPEHQSNKVSKCGIVETPLIVGGQRVNENEFPHMVNSFGGRVEMNFPFSFLFLLYFDDRHFDICGLDMTKR